MSGVLECKCYLEFVLFADDLDVERLTTSKQEAAVTLLGAPHVAHHRVANDRHLVEADTVVEHDLAPLPRPALQIYRKPAFQNL